ncbi:MAG: hypothetical protein RR404_03265 [Bacilli bacterium]
MNEQLKKIFKLIEGKIVIFGINLDKYTKIIETNHKITSLDVLENISTKKNKKHGKQRQILIKNLRKKYKKSKIDVIICNVDEVKKHLIYLIKETIYIGKKDVYLYGSKELVNDTLDKYKRYNISYKVLEFDKKTIIKIDISNVKTNKIRDNFYLIKDKLTNVLNIVTDILTS